MYYVYILFSQTINEYYCGQTNDLQDRLMRHNSGETRSIKHGTPWQLIGFTKFENRSGAVQLERKIKSRGIGRWLESHQHSLIQAR